MYIYIYIYTHTHIRPISPLRLSRFQRAWLRRLLQRHVRERERTSAHGICVMINTWIHICLFMHSLLSLVLLLLLAPCMWWLLLINDSFNVDYIEDSKTVNCLIQQNLNSKGWNSHVHREFPRGCESTNILGISLVGRLGVNEGCNWFKTCPSDAEPVAFNIQERHRSKNNFAICFLFEIPLREFIVQMKLSLKNRIPNNYIYIYIIIIIIIIIIMINIMYDKYYVSKDLYVYM